MTRLQRRFPSPEALARSFVRRLSERGMEIELPRNQVLPAGTEVEIDLRLEDGSALIVGRGTVGGTGEMEGCRRVRFVELDPASRARLPGLLALFGPPGHPGARAPAPPAADRPDPDETLADLVAGVFGERERPQVPSPDDTILVPPELPATPDPPAEAEPAAERSPLPREEPPPSPDETLVVPHEPPPERKPPERPPAPTPAASAPPAAARPAVAPPPAALAERGTAVARRPSLFRRLQVSPAVIVASIIAGATGAAANAWFGDLVDLFTDSRGTAALVAPPVVDIVPVGVTPSQFPEPEGAPAEPDATDAAHPAGEAPAPSEVPAATTGDALAQAADLPGAPEAAPTAGAEPASDEPAAPPADRVRLITWDEGATETVVTFWGNGEFLPERIVRFRVAGGYPRELIRLRGIDVPFPQTVLELGTPEVVRVRTGFHPKDPVNELHVVLDLSGPDVVLDRIETAPERLLVHLRREAAPSASAGE